MAPFYTGQGDFGDTGYLGEGRISKTSLRIEALGSVDEATAALGMARALSHSETTQSIILHIQRTLYYLMAELSADPKTAPRFDKISQGDITWLETQIETLENTVVLPREFILPGECPASGALALARTIIRRAERRTIALFEAKGFEKSLLIAYLNRLSSLIFVLEVYENTQSGYSTQLAKEE